jgi:DNA-binding IclR family transcriptional regulator
MPITSILKAACILRALADEPGQSVSALSRRLGIPKGTLFPFLRTLVSERFVSVNSEARYQLGLGLLELGQAFLRQLTLRGVARPHLENLAKTTEEVVHLTLLSEGDVVYVERVETRSVIQVGSRIGGRCPFHCTGVGKAYAAFLPDAEVRALARCYGLKRYTPTTITSIRRLLVEFERIRRVGYAIDNSEHDPEVRCVGAPLFDHGGHVVASISVAGPAYRMTEAKIRAVIPATVKTARAISQALGYIAATDGPRATRVLARES